MLLPGLLTLLVSALYTGWRLASYDGDPVALAELGSRFGEGMPEGSSGYDGQFNYYIALNPNPHQVAPRLDVPAYRYQRILYPLSARLLALGRPGAIGWTLLAVNLTAHALGTAGLAAYLQRRGLSAKYALSYGLWVGLLAPVGLDLSEPLSYALVVAGWLLLDRRRPLAAAGCLTLAQFAKETALVFWAAALAEALAGARDEGIRPSDHREPTGGPLPGSWPAPLAIAAQQRRQLLAGLALGGLAFAVWQLWLLAVFGRIGLGSGGDLATPFEWLPFMGLWRIGAVDLRVLALFLVIFGPSVVFPSAWGAVAAARSLLKGGRGRSQFALLFSSAAVMVLPFSTFREPLGLVRAADGLVLAVVLFASDQFALGSAVQWRRWRRVLQLALFWIPLLAILLNR